MEYANQYILGFYFVAVTASLFEGLFYRKLTGRTFNWGSLGSSLVDFFCRKLLRLVPFSLSTLGLAYAAKVGMPRIELDTWWKIGLLVVLQDFFYYWYHRGIHTVNWFWNTHAVHHSDRQLTLSTAYRLGITGGITGVFIFYAPLVWMGFKASDVFYYLTICLSYQFWIHNEWIPKIPYLDGILNTPSNHRVHHSTDPRFLNANYGGVLILFDRLFGTYRREDELPTREFGLVGFPVSDRPWVVNFWQWKVFFKKLARVRSPKELVLHFIGKPA